MLPFSTNIILCVIEFFSVVLLHVAYALSQYGPEKAALISIGFLPALLTVLLYRVIRDERIVIRCFYVTENVTVNPNDKDALVDRILATAVFVKDAVSGEEKCLFKAGTKLHPHDIDDLIAQNVAEISVIKLNARIMVMNDHFRE